MAERKSKIPKDFAVTDDIRAYCLKKWGLQYLPDVFLADFKECFESNGKTHYNWDTTYKTYIRNNSPSGRFYTVGWWERRAGEAKRFRGTEEARGKADAAREATPRSTWIPAAPAGLEALKHIRTFLPSRVKP